MNSEGHTSAIRILRDVPEIEARELSEREARKVMREEFGQDDGFPDSEFDDSNMAVLDDDPNEVKPSRLERHFKRAWR